MPCSCSLIFSYPKLFLIAHSVHNFPSKYISFGYGLSQHSRPQPLHVVNFQLLLFGCGTFSFNGIQIYPCLSVFFLGSILTLIFVLPSESTSKIPPAPSLNSGTGYISHACSTCSGFKDSISRSCAFPKS